jgi:hypothetical protein
VDTSSNELVGTMGRCELVEKSPVEGVSNFWQNSQPVAQISHIIRLPPANLTSRPLLLLATNAANLAAALTGGLTGAAGFAHRPVGPVAL